MILYAATISLSAFLLFLVQPIIARQILPWFGGSAAVWTTCMVFFQVVLLAGYAYADFLTRRVPLRRQAVVHTVLLLASLAMLPIVPAESFKPADADNPIGRILLLLAATIGLPYLMLSTTGPLVQAWFSRRFLLGRVYRLYALSNLASMLALIAYPPLFEPLATNRQQSVGWSAGYAVFALLAMAAAWRTAARGDRDDAWTQPMTPAHKPVASSAVTQAPADAGVGTREAAAMTARSFAPAPAPSLREHLLWLTLAATGSVLLLAVTTHITQNVASIPFLWVLPLALYLITFILCFDGRGWYWRRFYTVAAAVMALLMLAALKYRLGDDWGIQEGILQLARAVPLYAAGLFVVCMFCHGELARRKPAPAWLTRFFLMVSLGGALGGLAVGIAAPLLLDWYWELPVVLILLCLLAAGLSRGLVRLAGVAALACGVWLAWEYAQAIHTGTIELSRNFYGTLRVRTTGADDAPTTRWRLLHGVILHGEQIRGEQFRRQPTTYYGASSGVGRAIGFLQQQHQRPLRIGLIGLGVGTLAAYGRPGDQYRFYELNPAVLELARRRFSYLADSGATIATPLGDARLVLEREAPQRFDLLAIDAFSSDSIPVHLITREASELYRRHLADGGVIAFHISNRYLNLVPITRRLADDLGLPALRVIDDPDETTSDLYRSDWVLITGNEPLLQALRDSSAGIEVEADLRLRPWTDDYNNLFQVLK